MSDFVDPFAGAPADEAQVAPAPEPEETVFDAPPAEAPAPATAKKAPAKKAAPKAATAPGVQQGDDGKVVVTFKGGTGFDAPWIVIHATSLDDALDQVSGENASTLAQLMERAQVAGKHFAGLAPVNPNAGARPQRQAAPAAAQTAPTGSPAAPGPDWVYKTGLSKSGPKVGQMWQAWMPPQHLKDVEKPVWF